MTGQVQEEKGVQWVRGLLASMRVLAGLAPLNGIRLRKGRVRSAMASNKQFLAKEVVATRNYALLRQGVF